MTFVASDLVPVGGQSNSCKEMKPQEDIEVKREQEVTNGCGENLVSCKEGADLLEKKEVHPLWTPSSRYESTFLLLTRKIPVFVEKKVLIFFLLACKRNKGKIEAEICFICK